MTSLALVSIIDANTKVKTLSMVIMRILELIIFQF